MSCGERRSEKRKGEAQRGFTLIELLVVIIILGILSAIVVFAVRGSGDKGQDAAVQTDERIIQTALEVFCARNNRYPGGPVDAPDPFKNKPMEELVAGKYLSNLSEYYTLITPGVPPRVEGNCPGSATSTYTLSCTTDPCGAGGGQPEPPQQTSTGVAAGQLHSLRVSTDGKVFAAGNNFYGQLGDGTATERHVPVPVSGPDGNGLLEGVKAVAAGSGEAGGLSPPSSLALKNDGTVWTWGSNAMGQLGTGDTNTHYYSSRKSTPVQVNAGESGSGSLTGVTAIARPERGFHALALKTADDNGTVWAWGSNEFGQLGNGSSVGPTAHSGTPVQVTGLSGIKAVDAGPYHSLALTNDGAVWSWGSNTYRQLGNGTNDSPTPVQVQGLDGPVKAIAAGRYHSVALKEDGTVWVWGQAVDTWGSDDNVAEAPVQVSGLSGVGAIASGDDHVLASKNGEVWAWGDNTFGQLGNGTTLKSATPVSVKGLNGVDFLVGATALSAGDTFSLAVGGDGRVLGWGNNYSGQLGDGYNQNSLVPVGPYQNNDAFAAGIALSGASGSARGNNRLATKETGEPGHRPGGEASGGKSVLYRWTAPAGAVGDVTFNTAGSGFNTTMGVYTGGSVSTLTTVTQNDDFPPGQQSQVTFQAAPGVVYHIAVDGSTTVAQGTVKLAWTGS